MPNIIFYLNTGAKDKKDRVPLMAKIIHEKKRYYKTVAKINEQDWNLGKKRISANHKNALYNGHKEVNATLNNLESITLNFTNYCLQNDHHISGNDIEKILKGINPIDESNTKIKINKDFDTAFDEWIKYNKENNQYNTHRSRNSVFNFFVEFQKDQKVKITFRNIDDNLFEKLKRYAFDKKKYSNNTFAKTIKTLKTFLNWATKKKYYTGKEHLEFKAPERDVTPITLTIDEFKTLYDYSFESKKLQRVRDIFCFGCVTGLRYSDLNQLHRENIQGDYIVVTMKKVKEVVKIPLNKYSREILQRYQDQSVYALPRMSNQKLNDYIEEICEKAEINSPVIIDSFRGNVFTQTTVPKYKVITAHVARKTFVTISFYLDMNMKYVQSITGITQEKTLRKYLDIADEMKKTAMDNTWGKL